MFKKTRKTKRRIPKTGIKHEKKQDSAIKKLTKFMKAEERFSVAYFTNSDLDLGGNVYDLLYLITEGDGNGFREGTRINLKSLEWNIALSPGGSAFGTGAGSLGARIMVVLDKSPQGSTIAGPGLYLSASSNAQNFLAVTNELYKTRFRILKDIFVSGKDMAVASTRAGAGAGIYQGSIYKRKVRVNFKTGLKVSYQSSSSPGVYQDLWTNSVFLIIFPENDDLLQAQVSAKVIYTP